MRYVPGVRQGDVTAEAVAEAEVPGRDAAEATRAMLLEVARRTFARRGYAGTSLRDIVGPAGLTKGALYHHFKSKADLFEAVYVQLEEELRTKVEAALGEAGDDPRAQLEAALDAFFEASAEPAYLRVVLEEAPAVLRLRTRAIDRAIGLELVAELMRRLVAAGELPPLPVEALAGIFLAATGDVALEMASAGHEAAHRDGRAVIDALFTGLRLLAQAERE